jgi:hypothetical protein
MAALSQASCLPSGVYSKFHELGRLLRVRVVVRNHGYAVSEVAQRLGVKTKSLYTWTLGRAG